MISEEEVKHIAKLARLELTEKEIEKMQKDLSKILDYFDVLKKAPVSVSKKHSDILENKRMFLRADEVEKSGVSDKIVEASPEKKDGYIKVKAIL